MRIAHVVAFLVALTLAKGAGAQEARTITVTLPGDVAAASNRVVAALADRGITVADAQGAVVRSAPYRFNGATDVIVTANLIRRDSATTVILSGTYSIPTLGVREQPMTESTSRLKGQLWAWLEKIATKVEAKPAS